jgi:branched-chain amino acid transport system permease protein
LVLFLGRTGPGLRIRAAAANRTGAEVSGVRFGRTQVLTFGIGTGMAALAGALLGPRAFFTSDMGQPIIAKSFAIIVIFGLASVGGAFWAALILGVLESVMIGYLPSAWSNSVSYLLLLVVILGTLFRDESYRLHLRLRHRREVASAATGEAAA